jgi:hypothetical protein
MKRIFSANFKEIFFAIFVTIISTVILDTIKSLSFTNKILLGIGIFLVFILIVFFYKYSYLLSSLDDIGIKSVKFGKHIPKISEYNLKTNGDFYFLGISAKRIINNLEIQEKIIQIARTNNHSVKFLLLNPNSTFIQKAADRENTSKEIWQSEIISVVAKIKELKEKNNLNIEVKYYSFMPIWRLIIMNGNLMYLTYFTDNREGIESPMLELIDESDGDNIYRAYKDMFYGIWENWSEPA